MSSNPPLVRDKLLISRNLEYTALEIQFQSVNYALAAWISKNLEQNNHIGSVVQGERTI